MATKQKKAKKANLVKPTVHSDTAKGIHKIEDCKRSMRSRVSGDKYPVKKAHLMNIRTHRKPLNVLVTIDADDLLPTYEECK